MTYRLLLRNITAIALVVAIVAFIGMRLIEPSFDIHHEPYQKAFILKVEFAATEAVVVDMFRTVSCEGKRAMGFHTGLDYLFMVTIFGYLALIHTYTTQQHPQWWIQYLGTTMAIAAIIAMLCDAFENYCLINWLLDSEWKGPFAAYYWLVRLKWFIALIAAITSSALWVGNYVKYKRFSHLP
jgi:hypothetical protein